MSNVPFHCVEVNEEEDQEEFNDEVEDDRRPLEDEEFDEEDGEDEEEHNEEGDEKDEEGENIENNIAHTECNRDFWYQWPCSNLCSCSN